MTKHKIIILGEVEGIASDLLDKMLKTAQLYDIASILPGFQHREAILDILEELKPAFVVPLGLEITKKLMKVKARPLKDLIGKKFKSEHGDYYIVPLAKPSVLFKGKQAELKRNQLILNALYKELKCL